MDTDSLNSSLAVAGNSEMAAIGRHNVAKVQSWTLAESCPHSFCNSQAPENQGVIGEIRNWIAGKNSGLIIPHSLELNARRLERLLILKTPLNSRKCLSFSVGSHHVYIYQRTVLLVHRRDQSLFICLSYKDSLLCFIPLFLLKDVKSSLISLNAFGPLQHLLFLHFAEI